MKKKINYFKLASNIYFKKKTPVSLIHFLTNRCNARCSFCFIDFENPNIFKNELTLNEIDKMTKTLLEMQKQRLSFANCILFK